LLICQKAIFLQVLQDFPAIETQIKKMAQMRRIKFERKVDIINGGLNKLANKMDNTPKRLYKATEFLQKIILKTEDKSRKKLKNSQMDIQSEFKQNQMRIKENSRRNMMSHRKGVSSLSGALPIPLSQNENDQKFSLIDQIRALAKKSKLKEKLALQNQNREKNYQMMDSEIVKNY